jgi:hypothetical protein
MWPGRVSLQTVIYPKANGIFQNSPWNCLKVSPWKRNDPELGVSGYLVHNAKGHKQLWNQRFQLFILSNTHFHRKPFNSPWFSKGHDNKPWQTIDFRGTPVTPLAWTESLHLVWKSESESLASLLPGMLLSSMDCFKGIWLWINTY